MRNDRDHVVIVHGPTAIAQSTSIATPAVLKVLGPMSAEHAQYIASGYNRPGLNTFAEKKKLESL